MSNVTSKNKRSKRVVYAITILVFSIVVLAGIDVTIKLFKPNVPSELGKEAYILIPTDADFQKLMTQLQAGGFLKDTASFNWAAEIMGYTDKVVPGRYRIRSSMSNFSLIRLLKSGIQEPVQLIFNFIRQKKDFAGFAAQRLELDSLTLLNLLNDSVFLSDYGFTPEQAHCMFIPNTYEVLWNISPVNFVKKMHREYQRFWNDERREKAEKIGLSPIEVSILAAIVDQETINNDEMNMIAGVYMNRLKRGKRLQADPTVVFANGDFKVRRVKGEMLSKDSPYNTYKYAGLPPGPIAMPSIAAIDAVLNYAQHDYEFFCARDDFSGYHAFASNFVQHKLNAIKFQRAMNKRKIK